VFRGDGEDHELEHVVREGGPGSVELDHEFGTADDPEAVELWESLLLALDGRATEEDKRNCSGPPLALGCPVERELFEQLGVALRLRRIRARRLVVAVVADIALVGLERVLPGRLCPPDLVRTARDDDRRNTFAVDGFHRRDPVDAAVEGQQLPARISRGGVDVRVFAIHGRPCRLRSSVAEHGAHRDESACDRGRIDG
jgi:hypothetical protein